MTPWALMNLLHFSIPVLPTAAASSLLHLTCLEPCAVAMAKSLVSHAACRWHMVRTSKVTQVTLVYFSFGCTFGSSSSSAAVGKDTHFAAILRCELFCNVWLSSKILNLPSRSTDLKKEDSIGFVRQSASIIAVEIQRHCECPSACCLISITSTVVLHSSQLGTASLVTKSYKLLQSVISRALGHA